MVDYIKLNSSIYSLSGKLGRLVEKTGRPFFIPQARRSADGNGKDTVSKGARGGGIDGTLVRCAEKFQIEKNGISLL